MTATEILKHSDNIGHTYFYIKPRGRDDAKRWQYDVKGTESRGRKHGWVILDAFTLSALKAVFNALSPEHQAKYDLIDIMTLINFTWKHVKTGGA